MVKKILMSKFCCCWYPNSSHSVPLYVMFSYYVTGWCENVRVHYWSRCGAVTVRDAYTQELTRQLYDDITALTGRSPTMVINLLARVKLDANRDINEATFGEAVAIEAWEEFHRLVGACTKTSANGGLTA